MKHILWVIFRIVPFSERYYRVPLSANQCKQRIMKHANARSDELRGAWRGGLAVDKLGKKLRLRRNLYGDGSGLNGWALYPVLVIELSPELVGPSTKIVVQYNVRSSWVNAAFFAFVVFAIIFAAGSINGAANGSIPVKDAVIMAALMPVVGRTMIEALFFHNVTVEERELLSLLEGERIQ